MNNCISVLSCWGRNEIVKCVCRYHVITDIYFVWFNSQDDRIGKDVGLLMSEDSNVYPTKQELPACNITSFQYSYNQYCMKRVLCGEIRGSVSDQGIKLESWKYRQMLEPGCITICLVPKQESHLRILLVSKHFFYLIQFLSFILFTETCLGHTSFSLQLSLCLSSLIIFHIYRCDWNHEFILLSHQKSNRKKFCEDS